MHLSIPPGSNRPLPAEVHEALERLRAEAGGTEDPKVRAILLHEIGVVEEIAGDDHAAARDLLQAVNADTALREPLEQLAFLLERRGSFKNLPRLLERMVRVAATDEERARAHEALADFAADVSLDFEGARKHYELARECDETAELHLALQLVAEELSDRELALDSAVKRANAATHESYRAALWLCVARRELEMGEPMRAQASLERATRVATPTRWPALLELERMARLCNDPALARRALLEQAELLDAASRDEVLRRRLAIDPSELSAGRRADAWLRVAQISAAAGDSAFAVEQALKARALLPADLAVLHWLLEHAEALDDDVRAKLLSEELLGATDPDTIAALTLLEARDAARQGDSEAALRALARCREHEPDSVVAQALEYESLLRRPAPGSALSEALQRIADLVPEGEARSRYQALAAVAHALGNEDDATTSHALLSKALQHGSDSDAFARLGRSLAARAGDRKWFLEATQRVLRTARPNERPGLLFDLVRTSLSIGDETAASFNLDEASDTPEGSWVAATLNAYAAASAGQDGNSRSERALRALSRLGSLDPDPDRAFAAKHLVQSLRAKAGRSASQKELEELHRERPSDVVLALQLSDRSRDPVSSARVLSETADACTDVELSFILHLLAAIHGFRAGERERAIRDLKQAQTVHPEVVAPLLSWALRSAHPDDIEERRLMLDALRTSGRDPDLYALERFGLEVGSPSQRGEATAALDQARPDPASELGQALILARALWPVASGHAEALAWLEQRGESGREIARALAFLHERRSEDASPERLLASSRRWAETGSLAGGLEWLSVALCQGDWEEEIRAREQIAKELGASAAASLRSSSLLIAWLSGQTPDLLAADAPLSQLANLEVAPPGCDPRRRAHALSTAESALSSAAGHTALILAGYNQLFAGAAREALGSFHTALSVVPDDLGAWEGIRAAAEELGNVRLAADALHKLASLTRVPGRAAELERTRADLLGQVGDAEASQRALERAVELDVEHFESFNRLFRRFRGEKRYDKVLELADRRLQVTNDSREVAKLCWERARAYRSLGNMDAALADLDTVRVLDPSHPGPAALAGEIYVTLGDMDKAADELSKLAAMESAPGDQRLMSGIAAADLFDGKLNQPARAVHVLESLHSAGLGTLATAERLAKSLARVERWEAAVHQLESLMHRREDQEGRMQAARLCLVICRDQLETPARAFAACEKLLGDAPADAEALDYLLLGGLRTERSLELVRIGRESILEEPTTGFDLDRVTRLSRIAERVSDRDLLLATLGLLACTEATSRRIVEDADALLLHTARWPARSLTDEDVRTLFADALDDPVGELCVLLAPYVPLVMPPNTKTLGLGRRDRLKSNAAPELFEELHGWLDATGNGSAEVYAGGVHDQILLLPTEKAPILVLGPELRAPLTREQQATLARRCIGGRAGLSSVDERPVQEVVAVISAACAVGEVEIPGTRPVPDLVKALGKELPRRVRKMLPDVGGRIRARGIDPHEWTKRALRGLDRAEALALGDVSRMLLGKDERARGGTVTGHFNEAQERRLNELSAFMTSTAWRNLRERLGLAHP